MHYKSLTLPQVTLTQGSNAPQLHNDTPKFPSHKLSLRHQSITGPQRCLSHKNFDAAQIPNDTPELPVTSASNAPQMHNGTPKLQFHNSTPKASQTYPATLASDAP